MASHRIIVLFLLWFVAMFVFGWIRSSGVRPRHSGDPSFRTLNSDELFFRNLRISEYYASFDESGILEILRHKDLIAFEPVVPELYLNGSQNEAYLRFQGIPVLAVLGNDSVYIDPDSELTTSFRAGFELLTLLDKGAGIQFISEGKHFQTLRPGSTESKAYRESLEDFFRLIRGGNNY